MTVAPYNALLDPNTRPCLTFSYSIMFSDMIVERCSLVLPLHVQRALW
jgi:hypothetical protein